ncbi:DeoR/GlpR family DNA-binding transcription regulator [Vibrio sp. dhg]|uniref:DeoR/GlpR family DNA-binding transcription regulator n=1 Tax=Vibrio sp. dhg TaxID=2163016 RepID=UPI000E4D82C1|nr:DeoR/GlpR family DNA-binding transcription regulator [Vibrio sp. dhg]AXT71387.1 DeoR/GlpR transcriptional regulator [Vibrio sp. dhg]
MNNRQNHIVDQVRKQGEVKVEELAVDYGVSVETIRRDLNTLAKHSLLCRTHGGAVSLQTRDIGQTFSSRQKLNAQAKHVMAKHAQHYLIERSVIGMDASSTCLHVARQMPDMACTLVTNSTGIMQCIASKEQVSVIVTGGSFSVKYSAFHGPIAEQALSRLNLDVVLLSCSGVDENGAVWESNELNASIKRRMLSCAAQVVLLADTSKIGKKGLIKICDATEIDIFISDSRVNSKLRQCLKKSQVLVIDG